MDVIEKFDSSIIVKLFSGYYNDVFSKYFIATAVPILIIAMINCFVGHKIFKVFVGLVGIIVGASAGAGICIGIHIFMEKGMPNLGIIVLSMIVGAFVIGFASFKFYKAGAFFMGLITGVILGVVVMKVLNKDEYVIAAVIGGLLMGLLAIDLYKHMVIILTSVNGALIAASCIAIITKNDDPMFILKLGAGLFITGIIVQYIISLFDKRKNKDDDEDEINDMIEEKVKTKTQVANAKNKKINKKHTAIKQKDADNSSGLFLVDIISGIAQFIKDKILNYLNAEDIEEEDAEENYEDEDYNEDDHDKEEVEEYVVEERKQKPNINNKIIIKANNDNLELFTKKEKEREKIVKENIDIPLFDMDEIGHQLEAQLDNHIDIQNNEELEDLIIKQTIHNIQIH